MDIGEEHKAEAGHAPEEHKRVAVLQEVGRDRRAAHRRDEVQRHLVRDRVQQYLSVPSIGRSAFRRF